MLDFLQDLRWETISEWQTNSVFVTLFVALALLALALLALALLVGLVNGLGWYLRGRKRRQVVANNQHFRDAVSSTGTVAGTRKQPKMVYPGAQTKADSRKAVRQSSPSDTYR